MRVNLFVFVRLVSATVIIAAPIDWFSGNGAESLVDYSDIEEQTDDEEPFDISISPSELKALDMFLKIWNEESKEYARQHVPSIDFLTEDNEKKRRRTMHSRRLFTSTHRLIGLILMLWVI
ncbi:hypothetical protein M3Y98_00572200 [Aphelenchoides besseyi]|nr:hypothetical protein M3Y98_00572200 [Aphelenchoides besseyi]